MSQKHTRGPWPEVAPLSAAESQLSGSDSSAAARGSGDPELGSARAQPVPCDHPQHLECVLLSLMGFPSRRLVLSAWRGSMAAQTCGACGLQKLGERLGVPGRTAGSRWH